MFNETINNFRVFFVVSIVDQPAGVAATASADNVYDNFPVPSTCNMSVQKNGIALPKLVDHLIQNNLDIGSMVEVRVNLSLFSPSLLEKFNLSIFVGT